MAEMATGYRWVERVNVNKLGEYLEKDSTVSDYFRQNVATWWAIAPQLEFILEEMYKIFKVTVSHEQASALFMEQKDVSRMWPQHLLYLTHLAWVNDSSERRIIDNIVKHAAPENKHIMLIRLDPNRTTMSHTHKNQLRGPKSLMMTRRRQSMWVAMSLQQLVSHGRLNRVTRLNTQSETSRIIPHTKGIELN